MKELKSIFYCIIIIPIHSELGNDFAKQTLKHPNIKVLLFHPDGYDVTQHTFNLISRLSHNEKIVVVDQSIAFIGGIYLAFGRWDNHNHELTDNYPIHPCIKDKECSCDDEQQCDANTEGVKLYQHWVGKDYCNTFQVGDNIGFIGGLHGQDKNSSNTIS